MYTRSLMLAALTVAVAACGGGGSATNPVTPPGPATGGNNNPVVTTSVTLLNSAFTPSAIQVSPSATVTFTNSDNTTHNVTFSNATIGASGDFNSGSKTLVMPAATGTYAFHCTIHAGMTGSVVVQ
jgi:plastocyanin